VRGEGERGIDDLINLGDVGIKGDRAKGGLGIRGDLGTKSDLAAGNAGRGTQGEFMLSLRRAGLGPDGLKISAAGRTIGSDGYG